jgi:fructose-1,6-bisphosphatase/inositol monophosphatase family enzyme
MSLNDEVAAMMRGVAATVVMPRFRMLADHEIAEKSPGEVVTVADREAVRLL